MYPWLLVITLFQKFNAKTRTYYVKLIHSLEYNEKRMAIERQIQRGFTIDSLTELDKITRQSRLTVIVIC